MKDEDNPFKEMKEDLQALSEKDSTLVPENITAEDFASADDAVITMSAALTNEEMWEQATQIDDDEVEDIEDKEELVAATTSRDVENSLEILKNIYLFSEKRAAQIQDHINTFETLLITEKLENCKEVSISSYFVKEKYIFTVIVIV